VGIHADLVTNGLRIRGFAGLPDGSEWIADELVADPDHPEAAGAELARRMLAVGAAELLAAAAAMAAQGELPR
jgi:hydroxymethylbilane synthase